MAHTHGKSSACNRTMDRQVFSFGISLGGWHFHPGATLSHVNHYNVKVRFSKLSKRQMISMTQIILTTIQNLQMPDVSAM